MLNLLALPARISGAFAAALALAAAAPAAAGTVSNVAEASWQLGPDRYSTRSNEVLIDVANPQVTVATFVPLPGSQTSVELQASYCAARVTALATAAAPGTISIPVIQSGSVRVGQQVVLQLTSASANRDPAAIDTVDLLIVSDTQDEERVRAVETGPNTGQFLAAIATASMDVPIKGDCLLAVEDHTGIVVRLVGANGAASVPVARIEAQADPFGLVFDSATGEPVNGARVTLIDARTGAPAAVFAHDGVTPYPATLQTGSLVQDAAGRTYQLDPGAFLFPLAALGQYRLQVEPPAPYTAPSVIPPGQLALLPRPGGGSFTIAPGSLGEIFSLATLDPVRIDIPVDAPAGQLAVSKTGSRDKAQPGDTVVYRITVQNRDTARPTGPVSLVDRADPRLRLRTGSVRINGAPPSTPLGIDGDGGGFVLQIPSLAPQQDVTVTYLMSVLPDASSGSAVNQATVTAARSSAVAQSRLRIERDALASRMTLIGRVTAGSCTDPAAMRGMPGVRLVLEDGSFAVTDADGRYHFEGLVPGSHAVQLQRHTLPKGAALVDCTRTTHSAGSITTRFVRGQGGSIMSTNFAVQVPDTYQFSSPIAPTDAPAADTAPADGPTEQDWLALGDGPDGFVAPVEDANPRSPAIRVAVRHRADQTATLTVAGKAADPLSFEGVQKDPAEAFAVSHWRGIHLDGTDTLLQADLRRGNEPPQSFTRQVHFADTPMQAEILLDRSRLIADGTTPPVLAVRFRDRHGRPVHAGISGAFSLDGPYRSQTAARAAEQQALSGFGQAGASWVVEGDEGVALIELEPTLVSGSLVLRMDFADGDARRKQELEAWIEPGDQPWTLIGLAEGSVGARSVAGAMERGDDLDSDLGRDARVAFYAKGRVLGKYLLTLAYDSAKQRDDQPLLGVIDPAAYYTVFADGSQRAFDAQSREKLYVRVESAAFYALYGDFLTGFTNTSLAYYQRAATGVKAEVRLGDVQAQGFAARIASRHRRDEIQGSGLTGPYRLSSRYLVANSERVAIEVRDRLRSEVIVERRELVRFVDYRIDLRDGTVILTQPLAGRDAALNPQFLVADYEVDELGQAQWNGGGRVTWNGLDGAISVGATAITDKGDEARSNLGAADLRVQLDPATEVRAELAMSDGAEGTARAWSAEVNHHSASNDITAYARQVDAAFGVGQQNMAEKGRRKIGVDLRHDLAEGLSAVASAWQETALADDARRKAAEARIVYRSDKTDAFAGIAHLSDSRATGDVTRSTVVEAGATQRLLDNRVEMTGSTSVALGKAGAIDLPNRYRLGLRYAITSEVKAVAAYEITRGNTLESRSLQAGVELAPLPGSRIVTTLGRQSLGADARRDFAAFSLGQNLPIAEAITLDLAIDGNRTLDGGIALEDVANADQPVTSGGTISQDGTLGEDYMAYSIGAAVQQDAWSARLRAELRQGEFADQKGLSGAIIRELGEGRVIGGGFNWRRAAGNTGTVATTADAALSVALRPADSPLAFLGKLEFRSDTVTGATAGETGLSSLLVDGNARSRRLILSTSTNWSPSLDGHAGRTELSLFGAVRHDFDRVEGLVAEGNTLLGGIDFRLGVGENVHVGARGTVRASLADGTTRFAIGPELGFTPAPNTLVTVGYNVTGFRDRDFAEARSTHRGLFATLQMKFDQDSFGFLGRGR